MRRLRSHQLVAVNLDGETEEIECRVSSVLGPVATLEHPGGLLPIMRRRLTPGSLGFLVFDHGDAPVALRGVARAIPQSSAIEFVVIDGVQLSERRTAVRTRLLAPVLVTEQRSDEEDSAAEVETSTADLSLGGALLERRSALGEGPEWQIELFPSDPTPICRGAVLARETPTHLGVAFVDMNDSDRIRLAGILADHQRRGNVR